MERRLSPGISAVVTAYQRVGQTLETLRRLEACRPAPDEMLVHVDANEQEVASAIRAAFPHVRVFVSPDPIGPGGGRNRLVHEARNEWIASFDDDSYPMDADYFERVLVLRRQFPEAAVVAASIYHRGEPAGPDAMAISPASSFVSCGAVFKRSAFLAAGGFLPLEVAYGMEEEDLGLRLFEQRQVILATPWLRVFHDTDLSHHASARVTSATIANLALLAWLRYPPSCWIYGILQVANRVVWCLRAGRRQGVVAGLLAIPRHLARHAKLRRPVSTRALREKRMARQPAFRAFQAAPLELES